MANVFGDPVTNSTMSKMPEYVNKVITAGDRARMAFQLKNNGNRNTNARTYVKNLKEECGAEAGTLCLVYNATGHTMSLIGNNKNWEGHIGQAPYPIEIQNGQWGAFLHVEESRKKSGSAAGVVYRGKNGKEVECDHMMAWSNPRPEKYTKNSVWVETREAGHYDDPTWNHIHVMLAKARDSYNDAPAWEGCSSKITTGNVTTDNDIFVELEATFTLKDAEDDA